MSNFTGGNEETKMSGTIYLIHGYTASPTANWFPWLKQETAGKLNQTIKLLALPNPEQPHPDAWDKTCDQEITHKDGITIIGHSLGCIEALRYLDQHAIKDINLILVSGFDETPCTLPELAPFTQTPVDYTRILPKIKQAVVISALDDEIIPYVYSETLARHLQCKFVLMPTGGHFISRDNVTSLPVVYEELRMMIQ